MYANKVSPYLSQPWFAHILCDFEKGIKHKLRSWDAPWGIPTSQLFTAFDRS
jgi:hypothetical protein